MTFPDYRAAATLSPLEFTDQQIEKYQEAHYKHYGHRITKEQAARQYASVINVVRIALRHRAQKKKEAHHDG